MQQLNLHREIPLPLFRKTAVCSGSEWSGWSESRGWSALRCGSSIAAIDGSSAGSCGGPLVPSVPLWVNLWWRESTPSPGTTIFIDPIFSMTACWTWTWEPDLFQNKRPIKGEELLKLKKGYFHIYLYFQKFSYHRLLLRHSKHVLHCFFPGILRRFLMLSEKFAQQGHS